MKRLNRLTTVSGQVIKGKKIGGTIGFPTANLRLITIPKIKPGVYSVVCRLEKQSFLGLAYFSPLKTFEVYFFNFNQNIYGQQLTVELTHFLRPPEKINNLAELKKLLQADLSGLNNYVVLVNKNDQPAGIEEKIRAHQGKGKLHRAISVQLFNKKGKLLIQKRAKGKNLFAGIWANTVCTDVRPYENYHQAAERRLKEEFGLKAKLKPVFKLAYSASSGRTGSEREIDQVFYGLVTGRPRPNHQEISAWKYLSLREARRQIKTFAPWFQLILKKIKPSDIVKS